MTLAGSVWTPIGPSPINPGPGTTEYNGLVTAIAVHPNNNKIIYIGTAGGGVWRSADSGDNWTPLFDRQASLAIGEPGGIAIDPSNANTVYVGTSGRLIFRTFDSAETGTFRAVQAGLYKSTDAGASWTLLGDASNPGTASNLVGTAINVVLVDPSNSNRVYIATQNGVFVSTDGGRNINQGTGLAGDTRSLVLDPTSPATARILYAGVSGQGVFRSVDGGSTWTSILSGATAVLANALCPTPPCPNLSFGRFSVALAPPASPPNPGSIRVIYVAVEGISNLNTVTPPNPVGVFMSVDGGATWTKRNTGIAGTTYQGYCLHIVVDPTSPGDGATDTIYYGDLAQYVSTDSGNSFTQMGGMHSDTHAWAAVLQQPPATGSRILCGTDGGLAVSLDRGTTWTTKSRGGLQTTLFYNIDLKPDATVVVGGLQDNSLETNFNVVAPGWKSGGADGFSVAYDTTPGRVYGSENGGSAPFTVVLRSDDDGQTFPTNITPWGTTSDQNNNQPYIPPLATDPNNANTVYALGSQNLWQSTSGGNAGSWKIVWNGSPGPGNSVAVAPSNSNNVAVAVGSQVWVSTDINAATPTFTNLTPAGSGLPSRNVARVAFDPVDPTVIYAVLGGINPGGATAPAAGVFRRTIAGPIWTNISPPLNIPYSAIAIDGTDNPPTLYVGTEFGVLRSVDSGASWSVLDDLHLPRVPVLDLRLRDGRLCAGTYGRGVFAFGPPTGPVISFNLEHGLAFGTVCQGPNYLDITIYNVGVGDLIISSVQRLSGSANFTVLSPPSAPVVIAPGEELVFTVAYTPTGPGPAEAAIIRVISNDPGAPVVDLQTTAQSGNGELAFAFPDNMSFGDVCVGSFRDEDLVVNNRGTCPLQIRRLTSSSADFLVPSVVTFPLLVAPGTSIELPIRFQPLSFGAKSGTITIVTDDPAGSQTFAVTGVAPAPRLNLVFADTGNYGHVCVGDILDKPLTLTNSGRCTLSVTAITSSSPDFEPPEVFSYPLTIGPGDALEVPIRFQPTAIGPHAATITVTSDDPAGPKTLALSGLTPSGKLAVTGSLCIGGVKACHPVERTISICNVGECALHVSSVAFKRKTRHWRLVNNPFPTTLHPGSCLGVVVRYRADEQIPRCVELVIKSDDPDQPEKCLEALAYTIWECCDECKEGRSGKGQGCACCKCCPPDFCEEDDCKDDDD